MLDVEQDLVVDRIGDQAEAADVHAVEAVQPEQRGRDLPTEVGRDEDDAHVGGDDRLLGGIADV